jgi:glycosyltransferase involved in cell wall biosynthesis
VGDVKANLSPDNRAEIVAKTDEAGFAALLDRLLSDERLRESLAAANRAHVIEHYSCDRMFMNYGRIFDAALGVSSGEGQV